MIPQRLKALRKSKQLTQEQLGQEINVTKVSVSGYENGNRTPDTATLQRIADFFAVSVDYLLGRTDKPTSILTPASSQENLFFLDEENITPEEAEELKKHLEFLRYKAKEVNREETE